MAFQTGQPPYYDNFDPKYTKMLFRPGTSIQNGELNGIQTGQTAYPRGGQYE